MDGVAARLWNKVFRGNVNNHNALIDHFTRKYAKHIFVAEPFELSQITGQSLTEAVLAANNSAGIVDADISPGILAADISAGILAVDISAVIVAADISADIVAVDISGMAMMVS